MFFLIDFSFWDVLTNYTNWRAFQTNPGMYLAPRGICRVRWDPLPPSGDRHFSIGACSDFRSCGDTLKSLTTSKVRTKIGQPHDPSMWESGGTKGPPNSHLSLQDDVLILCRRNSRGAGRGGVGAISLSLFSLQTTPIS
jgi:hypothetical protein